MRAWIEAWRQSPATTAECRCSVVPLFRCFVVPLFHERCTPSFRYDVDETEVAEKNRRYVAVSGMADGATSIMGKLQQRADRALKVERHLAPRFAEKMRLRSRRRHHRPSTSTVASRVSQMVSSVAPTAGLLDAGRACRAQARIEDMPDARHEPGTGLCAQQGRAG